MQLSASDLGVFITGVVITTIGLAAIAAHLFRGKTKDRSFLWLGVFAAPYGTLLVLKTAVFQLTFGRPGSFLLFGERLADLATMIPALLLFETFYGPGWRSSVRWTIAGYSLFAAFVFSFMIVRDLPNFIPGAGTGIILLVPMILLIGRVNGYLPPPIPEQRILFWGLFVFFAGFARDHLRNLQAGMWRPGTEPYGLLTLIFILGYVAARRLVANEKQRVLFIEEMQAASRIQAAILPARVPSIAGLKIAARYSPMTAVAGDFYDFVVVNPGGVGVLVADVTGHGVPAALIASMVKVAMGAQVENASSPARVMTGLNSTLCRQAGGQYATAIYVYFAEGGRKGRYTAGGHPPPLIWRGADRRMQQLGESGLMLGIKQSECYSETEFDLEAGDRVLIYTDGVTEAETQDGRSFGDLRLAEFIKAHVRSGTDEFADRLLSEVLAWPQEGGQPSQCDDITLLVIDVEKAQLGPER